MNFVFTRDYEKPNGKIIKKNKVINCTREVGEKYRSDGYGDWEENLPPAFRRDREEAKFNRDDEQELGRIILGDESRLITE